MIESGRGNRSQNKGWELRFRMFGWGHAGRGSNQPKEHLVLHVRAVVAPSTHGVPEDGEVCPDAPAVEHQRPGEACH